MSKRIAPIIGRGGQTIAHIRDKTKEAKIHISARYFTSSERCVTINGDNITVIRACKLFCHKLGNKTRGQNHDLVDLYVYLCLSLFIFLSLLDLFGPMLTNLDQFRPI